MSSAVSNTAKAVASISQQVDKNTEKLKVEARIEPVLENGATNADANNPVEYNINGQNEVNFYNVVTTVTASTDIFTLEEHYRPRVDKSFVVNANGTPAIITVSKDGGVQSLSATTNIDLNSISFKAGE